MTFHTDPTIETRRDPTTEFPTDDVRPENPKGNPITYLALALASLALMLSITALADDDGPKHLRVGDRECLTAHSNSLGDEALFCQEPATPPPAER